jgi:hypothetical protein
MHGALRHFYQLMLVEIVPEFPAFYAQSSKLPLSFRFLYRNIVGLYILLLVHAFYMSHPSYSHWLVHSHNIL